MTNLPGCVVLTLLCVKVVYAAPSEGQQIADQFGEDLNFASKQFIRGFTSIIAPLLDTAQNFPQKFTKGAGNGDGEAHQNFNRVLLRDGINAVGKGVKASATILTVPARVAGTGLEEFKKVGQAGLETTRGADNLGPGLGNLGIEDKTKVASTLLNTTASEFSRANLGAILVEVALKNRIKDIANKTGMYVKSKTVQRVEAISAEENQDSSTDVNEGEQSTTTSRVDVLIERFNKAVKQNDQRLQEALQLVLSKINPPTE